MTGHAQLTSQFMAIGYQILSERGPVRMHVQIGCYSAAEEF